MREGGESDDDDEEEGCCCGRKIWWLGGGLKDEVDMSRRCEAKPKKDRYSDTCVGFSFGVIDQYRFGTIPRDREYRLKIANNKLFLDYIRLI